MLRILFDKNVPYTLRQHLVGYEVQTADDEGWERITNGELISCAEEAGYQILVTCDQNIRYQQNLTAAKSRWSSSDRISGRASNRKYPRLWQQ
jgi:hypothetical protein